MAICTCAKKVARLTDDQEFFATVGEQVRFTFYAVYSQECEKHQEMFDLMARAGLARCFLKAILDFTSGISWMQGKIWAAHEVSSRLADEYVDTILSRGESFDGDTTYALMIGQVMELIPLRFVAHFARNRDYFEQRIRMLYRNSEDVFVLSSWCKKALPFPETLSA